MAYLEEKDIHYCLYVNKKSLEEAKRLQLDTWKPSLFLCTKEDEKRVFDLAEEFFHEHAKEYAQTKDLFCDIVWRCTKHTFSEVMNSLNDAMIQKKTSWRLPFG